MAEKLSISKFDELKQKIIQQIDQINKTYYEKSKDSDFDQNKFIKEYIYPTLDLQNELLSYDLSDIPFEAWKGLQVISDESHIADFSKTKANIDFEILECSGNANFNGCNIKNIEKMHGFLNSVLFDEKTVNDNQNLFLSNNFSKEFQDKYYLKGLTIDDLASLTALQLEEIKQKNYREHMIFNGVDMYMLENFGLDKTVQLFNYSPEEYNAITELLKNRMYYHSNIKMNSLYYSLPSKEQLIEQLKQTSIENFKKVCFEQERKIILFSNDTINKKLYPKMFIDENADILLENDNIPDDVKNRYCNKELTFKDYIEYSDAFKNIQIDYFMDNEISYFFGATYGAGKFQDLLVKYKDIFLYLESTSNIKFFSTFLTNSNNLESDFINAVKEYLLDKRNFFNLLEPYISTNELGENIYNVPDWLSSIGLKFVEKISTFEDLLNYDEKTVIFDKSQIKVINLLNINNILQLDKETGIFSHKSTDYNGNLEMFDAICSYFVINYDSLYKENISFNNGTLNYEDFLNQFAKLLDLMRKNNVFTDFPNYDWIRGNFREKFSQIFIDINAPEELREAFYKNRITPELLYQHNEYIPYLIDKNLTNTLNMDMKLLVIGMTGQNGQIMPYNENFVKIYAQKYGNEKLLNLIAKYGDIVTNITINSLHDEIEDEELIEQSIKDSIYKKILNCNFNITYLDRIPEILSEHPEIYVDFNSVTTIEKAERQRLTKAFYNRNLTFGDIKYYPELVLLLKDKNLNFAFGKLFKSINPFKYEFNNNENQYADFKLLRVCGSEKFLELCSKYGGYLSDISILDRDDIIFKNDIVIDPNEKQLTFEDISRRIENIIIRECKKGNIEYLPGNAPEFLKEQCPELFLSEDAPQELKNYFYNYGGRSLTFLDLQENKEWLSYLKGKDVKAALLRNKYLKAELSKFFEIFGDEKALKLGVNRAETVINMINSHQVELMKQWYDKTGEKFIPDCVVMQNFSLDDADKFLTSASNWSALMKIDSFAKNREAREAMLKLAYSFGAFDQDQRGFKKLQDLLTELPRKIDADNSYILDRIDDEIDFSRDKDFYFMLQGEKKQFNFEKMLNYVKKYCISFLDSNILIYDFFVALQSEKIDIDYSKGIFKQLYKMNNDGTYTLTINPQLCPKTTKIVRAILNNYVELPIITPEKAHQLFGGFELKYDPDFREFLLANIEQILLHPEFISYISNIQKQFSEIKSVNSNRSLTLELAISYVQTNKYTSVNIGNEKVAEISGMAGYSQEDFNTLQQIYNYGKQRTYSSIPRIEQTIEKKTGNYHYEILRLDDPLAMAIGTLTDCCQEINNCAEVCMEHSMTSKDGRVFVIKDEFGNVVAQSWVWRNKDVLCFDNIEIPTKAFTRTFKEHPEIKHYDFTNEIFEIYKAAAHDLIIEDESIYQDLLKNGKITQEQYDGLRLGKVTVGLGYNDIAESIKENSTVDKGILSRPLAYDEPVRLKRGLYTNDSNTQYILEEREDRKKFDGEALPVHSDTYIEYDDSNFTERNLLTLEKLEIVTKRNPRYLDTNVRENTDYQKLVTEIARNYNLNPMLTKIIMNPNFAIIYEINDNKIKIGDLLFNLNVDNGSQQLDIKDNVLMQIRLALKQIASDKEIDVSSLDEYQLEIYNEAINLTDEMDAERGITYDK